MAKARNHVSAVDGEYYFPRGYTLSDNRIEDDLQRHISPAAYVVWRQYLRFWGANKRRAYPSLAHLSKVTGLSEKTIRKCNRELKDKKFINYSSGKKGRANTYYYKSVDDIMNVYYGAHVSDDVKEEEKEPILEVNGALSDKVERTLDELTNKERVFADMFVESFKNWYKNKTGFRYELEPRDANAIVLSLGQITKDIDRCCKLAELFFTTRNSYINKSDRSIFFFFRPKIQKALIAEYSESDEGRWEAQAEKIWNEIRWTLQEDALGAPKDIRKWVKDNTRLSGANKDRDEYVISYLVKKTREYLEANQ
jgi:hypothetical protein